MDTPRQRYVPLPRQALNDERKAAGVWKSAPFEIAREPWSAWPCGDLWNLMPAQSTVNQRQKWALLPTAERLRQAQDLIEAWWSTGYLSSPKASIPERFLGEATASLPSIVGTTQPSLDDVFAGVALQRLRLKQDQQVLVWT